MLRNETHLRAAQREADTYPREVHADGRSWQFWSLSAVANRHRPGLLRDEETEAAL